MIGMKMCEKRHVNFIYSLMKKIRHEYILSHVIYIASSAVYQDITPLRPDMHAVPLSYSYEHYLIVRKPVIKAGSQHYHRQKQHGCRLQYYERFISYERYSHPFGCPAKHDEICGDDRSSSHAGCFDRKASVEVQQFIKSDNRICDKFYEVFS